jgi:hypothetical protein
LTTKKGFKSLTRKPQGTTAAMGAKVDTISLSLSLSLSLFLHLKDVRESDCLVLIPIEMVVFWRDS